MTITGIVFSGAAFLAGMVVGVYMADKHSVSCEDLKKFGAQAQDTARRVTGFSTRAPATAVS